jgi:hypothetical protein
MKSKKPKILWIILIVFLISSLTTGTVVFSTSTVQPGNWFISFFLGALFGWAICAPIIRISYGAVPFLKIFAVLPFLVLPPLLLSLVLPSNSLLFLTLVPVWFLLSLSYLGWLSGMDFFVLFKRRTWLGLFNKSNQDDSNEKLMK